MSLKKLAGTNNAGGNGNLFRGRGPKAETVMKKGVANDEKLELLMSRFRECLNHLDWVCWKAGENFNAMVQLLNGISIASGDVRNFSLALPEFQNENDFEWKAGLFLSAMIKLSEENDFVVVTKDLKRRIDFLGFENAKNIWVKGDAGNRIGLRMKGGMIAVEGNAGNGVGWRMDDGVIEIDGDVGDHLGYEMNGEEIRVKGDAGDYAGQAMNGGKVVINGNAGFGAGFYMNGGEIEIGGKAKGSIGRDKAEGRIMLSGRTI